MGCDIHLYTEVKRHVNNIETWVCVDNFRLNPYYKKGQDYESQFEIHHIYRDRDYGLFSTLADVRNYYEIKPIDQARGLPVDVTETVRAELDRWGVDGHTHSWFTLSELYKYRDKNNTKKFSGMLSQDQIKMMDDHHLLPTSWCQGTSDKTCEHRSWSEEGSHLDYLISKLEPHFMSEFYCYEAAQLKEHAHKCRIVFWFDN